MFQDRFKSEPFDSESYLLTVLKYIHNNPVKASLNKTADGYQWSSYNEYIKLSSLGDVELVFGIISRDQFVSLHNEQAQENILDVKEDKFRMTDSEALTIVKNCVELMEADFLGLDNTKRNFLSKHYTEEVYLYGRFPD